jgi:predicted nuclease of predicted toxin-antitoxin system
VSDRIRFHLDEHVDPVIAAALRRHGIDVSTTPEAGLRTSDDPVHLEFSLAQHRVLVTHDPDFLRIAAAHQAHAGIAYCAMHSRTARQGFIILVNRTSAFGSVR